MTSVQVEAGHLTALNPETEGDELMVAVMALDTELVVEDAGDFDEDGGWLHIFSDTASELVEYITYDDDTSTITLASPLTGAYPVGARVDVWDVDTGGPVVEYVALVTIDGQEGGDPLEATVDHQLADKLRPGIRTGAGESVELEFSGTGGLRVAKVYGKTPDIDGRFVKNPFMRGRKAETTPTPHGDWTPVTDWDLTTMTPDISFDAGTGEFTVSKPGIYSLTFGATYAANPVGVRQVRPVFVLGGVTQAGRVVPVDADPVNVTGVETSQDVELDAGDTVRFDTIQNSGGPLDLMQFGYRTSVSLVRIAPS